MGISDYSSRRVPGIHGRKGLVDRLTGNKIGHGTNESEAET